MGHYSIEMILFSLALNWKLRILSISGLTQNPPTNAITLYFLEIYVLWPGLVTTAEPVSVVSLTMCKLLAEVFSPWYGKNTLPSGRFVKEVDEAHSSCSYPKEL